MHFAAKNQHLQDMEQHIWYKTNLENDQIEMLNEPESSQISVPFIKSEIAQEFPQELYAQQNNR